MSPAERLCKLAEQLETRAQVHTDTLDRLYIHDKQAHDTSALMLVESATLCRHLADAMPATPTPAEEMTAVAHAEAIHHEHARMLELLCNFRVVLRGEEACHELACELGVQLAPADPEFYDAIEQALLAEADELIAEVEANPEAAEVMA